MTPTVHYINGEFVSAEHANISVFDLGIIRGFGVFDYVQLYKGKPFHLRDHLDRLKWSAEQVGLELPIPLADMSELAHILIQKNPPIDAGIRFVITAGFGGEDHLLPLESSNLIMLFHSYTPHPERYYTKGMRALTTKMLRILPSVKTTNYMPAIFAMKRAKETGFDDALYLNPQDELLEGTTSNLFFLKDGKLITSDSDEIVKGVTRNILLKLVEDHYQIEYRSLRLDEVESCQEAFLCSSVKDVVPLVQIDNRKVGQGITGYHSNFIRKLYRQYLENYLNEVRTNDNRQLNLC